MEFHVSPDELPKSLAFNAHYGTSFVPEDRAQMEQREFASDLLEIYNSLKSRIAPGQEDQLNDEMARFKAGYLMRKRELLASRSRIVSAMIAGPSGFPAARMEKRNEAYQNKLAKFLEWRERAVKAMERNLGLCKSNIISSNDADAIEKLQAKIESAEKAQAAMKQANKIVRDKKLSDDEKVARMMALGLRETNAREALKPDFCGRVGFPDYALQNNNANIRRMRERIAQLERQRAQETRSIVTGGGATIIDNVEENRVQIFFPGKPDENTRARLKSHGFRWAPSVGAWQRFRSEIAMHLAREICGNG